MLLSMDKKGNVYQTDGRVAGQYGYERGVEDVEAGDVFLTDAAKFSEEERMRRWKELTEHNKREAAHRKRVRERQRKHRDEAKRAELFRAAQHEEAKAAKMGEEPLLEEAAMQYRKGADYEIMTMAGCGLTADGKPDPDQLAGFGLSLSDITSGFKSATETIQAGTQLVASTIGLKETVAPSGSIGPVAVGGDYAKMLADQTAAMQAQMAQQQAMMTQSLQMSQAQRDIAAAEQAAKTKQMITYAAMGLGGLTALMIVLKMVKK